jgi:hypothetical protein
MREAGGRFGMDGAGDNITDPVIRGLLDLRGARPAPGIGSGCGAFGTGCIAGSESPGDSTYRSEQFAFAELKTMRPTIRDPRRARATRESIEKSR